MSATSAPSYGGAVAAAAPSTSNRTTAHVQQKDQLIGGEPLPSQLISVDRTLETVPETPDDPRMWAGADDEGLGIKDRRRS